MKKIQIYFILLAVAALGSCTDKFLDEQNPNGQTTATFWKTEADLNAAMQPIYRIATTAGAIPYGPINVWRADYWCAENVADEALSLQNFTLDASNTPGFGSLYQIIFFSNEIIQNGGAMNIDEAVKGKYVAEAYFWRGLAYFWLANDWGSVPIRTSVVESKNDYAIASSPIEEVWQQAIDDFTEAASGLPATRPSSENGRATKGAALAFLGKSYLYMGNWAKAEETLKSIVDNATSTYGYDLQTDFAELYDGNHENGPEAVFEIQFTGGIGGTNIWDGGSGGPQTTIWGLAVAPGRVNGWEALWGSSFLLDSFLVEPTIDGGFDPRATATLAWDYPGNTFYQLDFHSNFNTSRAYIKKYANWWDANEGEGKSALDYYAMRYADVLLMLAEAYVKQGNVTAAAPLVKRIRDRANLPDINLASFTQEQLFKEIARQRNLEFAYEQSRKYDLRRWGWTKAVIDATSAYASRYSSKYDYYPIPQSELDANPLIEQNEAWKN